MPTASWAVDHAPSPTMCSAYSTAETSVISSPYPMLNPLSARTPRPTVASATAAHVIGGMRVCRIAAASNGVHTTYRPVTKPLMLAGVCASPAVCRTCATP